MVMTLGDLPEDDLLEYLVPPETDAGTRPGQAMGGSWPSLQMGRKL